MSIAGLAEGDCSGDVPKHLALGMIGMVELMRLIDGRGTLGRFSRESVAQVEVAKAPFCSNNKMKNDHCGQ